jgi:hypothetical protein
MSLSVAVATRRAIDAGLLPNPSSKYGDFRLRRDAIAALKSVQRRVEQALPPDEFRGLPDFFMLAIESRTWGFFHATAAGFDTNCRPEPPRLTAEDAAGRDACIVTSETALRRVLAGELPFSEAEQQGLIVIDADDQCRDVLYATWQTVYSGGKFNDFLCE